MTYLDHGATSFPKPQKVRSAVQQAMLRCANPGRGGYPAAMEAEKVVYDCREVAAEFFGCLPEQVVFTFNCTHGLNIAIRSLVQPGGRVLVSGFEHNAVMRPLYALNARVEIAGRKLFDWEDTLKDFDRKLERGVDAVIVTHVSNVFGYILPVEQIAELCRMRQIPLVIDAAQSAGSLPLSMDLGAAFIAMPGHKGLLGPQGTGILLCGDPGKPLLFGGTGVASREKTMPQQTPERLEAGTLNVPGIAGLGAGIRHIRQEGRENIFRREHEQMLQCVRGLNKLGMRVFSGQHQAGTVSFIPGQDPEEAAQFLVSQGIAVRSGLHCAPLAHESAGTLETGTVRISFGHNASAAQTAGFLLAASKLPQF